MQLNDTEQRQQVNIAKAQVIQAESQLQRLLNGARNEEVLVATAQRDAKLADLKQAQLRLARLEILTANGAVSQSDVDDAHATVNVRQALVKAAEADLTLIKTGTRKDEIQIQQARIASAKARLRLEEHKLSQFQLRAPSDGKVLSLDVEIGEPAGFDGEPALSIADTRRLRVRAFVDELDACHLIAGQVCTVTTDGLVDRDFTGRIIEVAPKMTRKRHFTDNPKERIDTQVREVIVELTSETSDLVVGLKVDVSIQHTVDVQTTLPLA